MRGSWSKSWLVVLAAAASCGYPPLASDQTQGGGSGDQDTRPPVVLELLAGTIDSDGGLTGFASPEGLAVDSTGNVYVAATGDHTIRMVAPTGTVSIVAGVENSTGGGKGPAATAQSNA